MFSIFNDEAKRILSCSKKEKQNLKHNYVGTEHFVLSLLRFDNSISKMLKKYNVTYNLFKNEVINLIGYGNDNLNYFVFTPLFKKIIQQAIVLSKERSIKDVSIETIFLCIIEEGEGISYRILNDMGVDFEEIYDQLTKNIRFKKSKKKLYIDEFGVNLNEKIMKNEIDPVYGRENELLRLVEILCRKNKNNPLLIGEAGVGKTAIVEELARKIVCGDVPNKLLNKRIICISMANLVSGTKYRGEFEERVTKIVKELEENDDVILFIDEIHTLVGAGGAEGAIDASNILKPALARGLIKIIGATTVLEYKKTIEKDKALLRRFQLIKVNEPSDEKTLEILKKIKPIYEKYHNVSVSDSILRSIIYYSNSYFKNMKQPDKSINLLDDLCSKTSLTKDKYSIKIAQYKNDLQKVSKLKREALSNNNYSSAYNYKLQENKLLDCINKLDVKCVSKNTRKTVNLSTLKEIIFFNSGINLYNDIEKIKHDLNEQVIGQKDAIDMFCTYIDKIINCYNRVEKPATFLFSGRKGVGKKMLAKLISKMLFNNKYIEIDGKDYWDENSLQRLFGIYNSSDEYICSQIKDNPFSIVLVDNFEYISKHALNIIYKLIDNGFYKDNAGNIIDFSKTLIIFLDNSTDDKSLGFENKNILNSSSIKEKCNYVIKFNDINKDNIVDIFKNRLNFYNIEYNEDDLNVMVDECNYKLCGALNVERIIKKYNELKYVN